MADYIDRQAAIAALREFAEECKGSTEAATAAAMAISVISRLGSILRYSIITPRQTLRRQSDLSGKNSGGWS